MFRIGIRLNSNPNIYYLKLEHRYLKKFQKGFTGGIPMQAKSSKKNSKVKKKNPTQKLPFFDLGI